MNSVSAVSIPSAVFVALGSLSSLPLIILSLRFVMFSPSLSACRVFISNADYVIARESHVSFRSPFPVSFTPVASICQVRRRLNMLCSVILSFARCRDLFCKGRSFW